MWISILALAALNIVLALAVTILWVRNLRPPKEDPRLSKGLQLLQSKISVLEDLSDRTDRQVKQLIQILEERAKNLQAKLIKADETLAQIEHSTAESMKVAKIFQDKIPHEEIIERQNTTKYVEAAKMAHAGRSVEEICSQLSIPRSEAEFITNMNKDELMFDTESLPDWMKEMEPTEETAVQQAAAPVNQTQIIEKVFAQPEEADLSNLERIRGDFDRAVSDEREAQARVEAIEKRIEDRQRQLAETAKNVRDNIGKTVVETTGEVAKKMTETTGEVAKRVTATAAEVTKEVSKKAGEAGEAAKPLIKKVRFPKIDPF